MVDRESDSMLLDVLNQHGFDFSKPAHIIHYMYFKAITEAERAAEELRSAGYDIVLVGRAPARSLLARFFGPRMFSCIAEKHAPVSKESVFATTDFMNALAEKHGGDYDGWEVELQNQAEFA